MKVDKDFKYVDIWPDAESRPYPRASNTAETAELFRRFVYILGYVVAGILLLTLLGDFQRMNSFTRIRWCHGVLMVATFSTVLSLLGPQYLRAARDFFQDDAAGVGLLEMGISLVLLAFLVLRGPKKAADAAPHCDNCGYNPTGNTSGSCPECGTAIPNSDPMFRWHHQGDVQVRRPLGGE